MIGEDFLCDLASNKWEKCVCLLLSRKHTMQISEQHNWSKDCDYLTAEQILFWQISITI